MTNIPSLARVYEDYFKIGAAVNIPSLKTHGELLKKHFNSVTAENDMKPASIISEKNEFSFENADSIIDFAEKNNMVVRGHTIVWHNQTPEHFFLDEGGKVVSAELLMNRLKLYMERVFEHFKGKVYCWDLVNEAVDGESSEFFRKTKWLEILGEDYIHQVFRLAREIAPELSFFYNDYDAVIPEKRDKIYNLLKGMLDRGIPLDGLGIQAHWNIVDFEYDDIRRALDKYAGLKLDIHITELDVSVYSRKEKNLKLEEPTVEMISKQAEFYGKIFEVFREYKDIISSVTLWGIADDYSWLDYFFGIKRKTWPLLFDEDHQPKEAFWRVVDF
ncbi:MAG: endo-1,4-beta-xylanase [Halanaerobiaceae bacterium]|nr:endo-1,4-beta-xylanase [Halanaerobiaceae bacterium]